MGPRLEARSLVKVARCEASAACTQPWIWASLFSALTAPWWSCGLVVAVFHASSADYVKEQKAPRSSAMRSAPPEQRVGQVSEQHRGVLDRLVQLALAARHAPQEVRDHNLHAGGLHVREGPGGQAHAHHVIHHGLVLAGGSGHSAGQGGRRPVA